MSTVPPTPAPSRSLSRPARFAAALCLLPIQLHAQTLTWDGGGDGVHWTNRFNWSGDAVPGAANDAVIPAGPPLVIASGTLSVRGLQCDVPLMVTNGDFRIRGSAAITGPLTVARHQVVSGSGTGVVVTISGPVNADGAGFAAELGAVMEIPGLETYRDTGGCCGRLFTATAGATLSLPGLTNLVGNPQTGWDTVFQAGSGGRLHLDALTTGVSGAFRLVADGSNSVVRATHFTTFLPASGSLGLEARNRGVVETPHLTQGDRFSLIQRANSSLNLTQLVQVTRGSLTLDPGFAVTLPQLTNIDGTDLTVSGGSTLDLPALGSVIDTAGCCGSEWIATGPGSRISGGSLTNMSGNPVTGWDARVQALAGGRIDLSAVTLFRAGAFAVLADGTNSVVDLARLAAVDGNRLQLDARRGGSILVPELRQAERTHVSVATGGSLPMSQFTTLARGSLTVAGATPIILPAVTNLDGASLSAQDGAVLELPVVRSFRDASGCCGASWEATGAASRIAMSGLTNLAGNGTIGWDFRPQALAGGTLAFPGLTDVSDGATSMLADGTNSLIQLPVLARFNRGSGRLILEARNSGTIQTPSLANGNGITLTYGTRGNIQAPSLATLQNGGVTVGGIAVALPALTNVQGSDLRLNAGGGLTLPAVTRLDTTSLHVSGGANLALPHVVSWRASGGVVVWEASGAGSVLDLPGLTDVAGGTASQDRLFIQALDGGEIRLPVLGRIPGTSVALLADGSNSTLRLTILTNITGGNVSGLESRNRGRVLLHTNGVVLTNLTVAIATNASLESGLILVGKGTVFSAAGELDATLVNAGRVRPGGTVAGSLRVREFRQTAAGTLELQVGGLTPGTGFDRLVADGYALLDGVLSTERLNSFNPPVGSTYRVMDSAALVGGFASYAGLNTGGGVEFVPLGDPVGVTLLTAFSSGPVLTHVTPTGTVAGSFATFRAQFTEPVNPATFSSNSVSLTGPAGTIALGRVTAVDATSVDLRFAVQTTPGTYRLVLGPGITDLVGNALNQDGDLVNGEPEDRYTNVVTLSVADLVVSDVSGPSAAAPGTLAMVSYTVRNAGSEPVQLPFTDQLNLVPAAPGEPGAVMAVSPGASPLAPGASLSVTQAITVPWTGPAGDLRFQVIVDSANAVPESSEANNTSTAAAPVIVPLSLRFDVPAASLSETGAPVHLLISRNGSVSNTLVVSLESSDVNEASLPPNATFPAGQASVTVALTPVHDGVSDGPRPIVVQVHAAGYVSGSNSMVIDDADPPRIQLTAGTGQLTEGHITMVTVTREPVTTNALEVTLASSSPAQLSAATRVVIPGGVAATNVVVNAVDDTLLETTHEVSLAASAPGHRGSAVVLAILDNDVPELVVSLAGSRLREGSRLRGTVSRAAYGVTPVRVQLSSGSPARVGLPADLLLPAGATSVEFEMTALDNGDLDGDLVVNIHAAPAGSLTGAGIEPGTDVAVTVEDDDSPRLSIVLERDAVGEGLDPATTATVTHNGPSAADVIVTLQSDRPAEAGTVPSLIIPAGANAATFAIQTPVDDIVDGDQRVTFTASAAGFGSGTATLVVSDRPLPDLVIRDFVTPSNVVAGEIFTVNFREWNLGLGNATGTWHQVVELSTSPVPGGGEQLGAFPLTATLGPGQFIGRSAQFRAPLAAGDYWLIARTDPTNLVTELLEDNNTTIAAGRLRVDPAFTATVVVDVPLATAGTPIPLHGRATRSDGQPAAFALVNLPIRVRGMERVIAALTDGLGNYSAVFTPLPGEAGTYTVGAAATGVTNVPAQASFILLGMRCTPEAIAIQTLAGGETSGSVPLINLGEVPLSGLSATVLEADPAVNVHVEVPGSLPPDGLVELQFTVTSTGATALTDRFRIRVSSAEGAGAELTVTNQVIVRQPRLVVAPGSLVAGVSRGGQVVVPLTIQNVGGADSGPLSLLLPPIGLLHVATPSPLPSLAPGESNTVTFQITAAPGEEFGDRRGTLVIASAGDSIPVPVTVRILSEAIGTLEVEAQDEYTYYASGAPRVTNALVRLRDLQTGLEVTNATVDAAGRFTGAFREGYYRLEVRADGHSPHQQDILVPAAGITNLQAFLSRQAVQYRFTVTPTEVEERTHIVVESVFETFVPMPVITVTPKVFDLLDFTNGVTQISLTISNHGLVAAQEMRIDPPAPPGYVFAPLITEIGTLPARSSLTIPMTVHNLNAGGRTPAARASARSGGACGGAVVWCVVCGSCRAQGTSLGVANGPQCTWNPDGHPQSGSGGGAISPAGAAGASECNPCTPYIVLAVANCGLGFLPLQCGGAIFLNTIICSESVVINGLGTSSAFDCLRAAGAAGITCAGYAYGVGAVYNAINCACDINAAINCTPPGSPPTPFTPCGISALQFRVRGLPTLRAPASAGGLSSADIEFFQEELTRAAAMVDAFAYLYGDPQWLATPPLELPAWGAWMSAFAEAQGNASPGGIRVTAAEEAALLLLPLPSQLNAAHAARLFQRWNRTADYYDAGYLTSTNLPIGLDPDFIALDVLIEKWQAASDALAADARDGYPGVLEGLAAAVRHLAGTVGNGVPLAAGGFRNVRAADGGLCARVRLRLDQEAVIARDAFEAVLELDNGSASVLENVRVELVVRTPDRADATANFAIQAPTLGGFSGNPGEPSVEPGATGKVAWTLIPTLEAAASPEGVLYEIAGVLRYRQDGFEVTVPLAAAPITVFPTARLQVNYFHQRDVLADDPFTADVVEPSQPYSLAVMVRNLGLGTARKVRISSAQPQIVENEKGLFIQFDLIATEVAGESLRPSLTVDFGDIPGGGVRIGRWLLQSSLQGQFIDYSATFEHDDVFNAPRVSVIESVDIHEMLRSVHATNTVPDRLPDFLVNDFADDLFLPDTLYLSDGSTAVVTPVLAARTNGAPTGSNSVITLQAAMPSGWGYLRVSAPPARDLVLHRVLRSDGAELPAENFWLSDRTFIAGGRRPLYETNLHLLDFNSTGSYLLVFTNAPTVDRTPPLSAVAALPALSRPTVELTWDGVDAAGGSGLATFDVYVSDNGGTFLPWLTGTTLRGAIYPGVAGHVYAFYTRARDLAGNVEPAPASPDTGTSILLTNHAPILLAGLDQVVDEGDTVLIGNSAQDTDEPADHIEFSLLEGPPGATIDAASGAILWLTTEGNGPSTNSFVVRVTDDGQPPLSATGRVMVVVNEVNAVPSASPLPEQTLNEGFLLRVVASATDPDLPVQHLSWELGPGAPAGMALDADTGLLSWRPGATQGPSTNRVRLIVRDHGQPSLSATQTLTILVRDSQADLTLLVGRTNVFGGESGAVPVSVSSGVDLAGIQFVLDVPPGQLADFALTRLAGEVSSATLVPQADGRAAVEFQLNGSGPLTATRRLADLGFVAANDGASARVPLEVRGLSGIGTDSRIITHGATTNGAVIVVRDQPLLNLEPAGAPRLTLYGHPGRSYQIESTADLTAGNWQPWNSGRLTNRWITFDLPPTGGTRSFRAFEQQP